MKLGSSRNGRLVTFLFIFNDTPPHPQTRCMMIREKLRMMAQKEDLERIWDTLDGRTLEDPGLLFEPD